MVEPVNRVAVKVANVVAEYAVDSFFSNAGTSPKQIYDVAGALVWSPHNMVLQSQTFQTTWNPTTVTTVTADAATAPDGTLTADKLTNASTANSNHNLVAGNITSLIAGQTYTFRIWAKAAEWSWLAIEEQNLGTHKTYFNLGAGTLGTKNAFHTNATITASGDGYLCTITWVSAGTTAQPILYLQTADAQGILVGVIGSGVYIWGAQFNRGSVPTAYLPTTTAARYGLALDYDPVTHAARGLLCEPAATNLLTGSGEFATGWTIGAGNTRAKDAAGPAGPLTACTLTCVAGTGTKWVYCAIAGGTYRYSVYAKAGTLSWVALGDGTGAPANAAFFNVSAGTVGTVAGRFSAGTIEAVGNGWYRCSATVTSGLAFFDVQPHSADNQTASWSATGGETLLIYQAQAETGTVATSPIPTFAASATRAADSYSCTPAQINHSATAGSWWAEFSTAAPAASSRVIAYNASAYPLGVVSATQLGLVDGTTLAKAGATLNNGSVQKAACAFQSGDRAITGQGLAPAADAGSTTLLLGPVVIYMASNAAFSHLNGYLRKAYYVPRRMTNVELVTKTT